MKEYPVFPNAPITEAVLDIKAKISDEITLETFEEFQAEIKDRFKERKTRHSFRADFPLSPGKDNITPPITQIGGADGYLFRSPKEDKIVQTRLDGFTFNKLRPYENWNSFRDEARLLWELYSKIAMPSRVEKIALRYINRIEIPLPFVDFNEYILINIQIPSTLPQGLSHFFMRLELPNEEIQAIAVITSTMQKTTESQKLPLIFDIDVQKNNIYTGEMSEMWKDFDLLRGFKNEIFFNSITEKAKELFK
jgi:uncharacterized protein (TIGR04255 family)